MLRAGSPGDRAPSCSPVLIIRTGYFLGVRSCSLQAAHNFALKRNLFIPCRSLLVIINVSGVSCTLVNAWCTFYLRPSGCPAGVFAVVQKKGGGEEE